jgi:hypothetical protein
VINDAVLALAVAVACVAFLAWLGNSIQLRRLDAKAVEIIVAVDALAADVRNSHRHHRRVQHQIDHIRAKHGLPPIDWTDPPEEGHLGPQD